MSFRIASTGLCVLYEIMDRDSIPCGKGRSWDDVPRGEERAKEYREET